MIEVVYTLTEAEFIEAQKLWCPAQVKKLPGHWVMQALSVIFGGFIGLSFAHVPLHIGIGEAVSLLAILLFQRWRKRAIRSYQYRSRREQREEVSVRIDEVGYHDSKAGLCGGWIEWQGFTGWQETANIFVLGRGLTFVTIPKRPLSVEQQDHLRDMARTRIPNR